MAQRELGLLDDAARSLGQALDDSLAVDARLAILGCLQVGAVLAADRNRPEAAAALLGAASQLGEDLEVASDPFEGGRLETVRTSTLALLGEERFARAQERGRSLLNEDAAELARTASSHGPISPAH
jgi:hypothetical protein